MTRSSSAAPRYSAPRIARIVGVAALLATAFAPPVHAASPIAFFNEADPDKAYKIENKDPVNIASVTLDITQPSYVLVQFTAHATTEDTVGCPCSLRAMFKADDARPLPVRRVNLGAPNVVTQLGYEHDRQGLSGSYVFEAAPGRRTYTLVMQQQSGDSKTIEVFYPNLQAIAFPRQ